MAGDEDYARLAGDSAELIFGIVGTAYGSPQAGVQIGQAARGVAAGAAGVAGQKDVQRGLSKGERLTDRDYANRGLGGMQRALDKVKHAREELVKGNYRSAQGILDEVIQESDAVLKG